MTGASQLDACVLVVERRQDHLMAGASIVIEHQDGWSIVQSQLAEGAALIQAFKPLIRGLAAGIYSRGNVLNPPKPEELGESAVSISLTRVARQQFRQLVTRERQPGAWRALGCDGRHGARA